MIGVKLAPVDRRILSLAIPALGSLAVEPVYGLVDTAIVGQLGTDQLAFEDRTIGEDECPLDHAGRTDRHLVSPFCMIMHCTG